MTATQNRASRIATLNDEFRQNAGVTIPAKVPGRMFVTSGVAALTPDVQIEILKRVREFSDFSPSSDPYREHDFGAIRTPDGERVFWKIDYFADGEMQEGTEQPDDPSRSFRTLTIMLAAEY